MPVGIFNPFKTKEKVEKEKAIDALGGDDAPSVSTKKITLDGGKVSIVLYNTDLEDVPVRLWDILEDIAKVDREVLVEFGIILLPKGMRATVEPGYSCLHTPKGRLLLYTNETENFTEASAFAHIGLIILKVNNASLIKKHGIEVVRRG